MCFYLFCEHGISIDTVFLLSALLMNSSNLLVNSSESSLFNIDDGFSSFFCFQIKLNKIKIYFLFKNINRLTCLMYFVFKLLDWIWLLLACVFEWFVTNSAFEIHVFVAESNLLIDDFLAEVMVIAGIFWNGSSISGKSFLFCLVSVSFKLLLHIGMLGLILLIGWIWCGVLGEVAV